MPNKTKQGIYAAGIADWLSMQRVISLELTSTPRTVEKQLIAHSQPPPTSGSPLDWSISVARTHTVNETIVFEAHLHRGLPNGSYYTTFIAAGQIAAEEGAIVVRGTIQPMRGGISVYATLIVLFGLWVTAATISSVLSPAVGWLPVIVAAFTTTLAALIILALLVADLRRVMRLFRNLDH